MRLLLAFIKKELLLFLRSPQELLTLLAMPLILIAILGFALGSQMNGEMQILTGKVALITHSNEEEEFEAFQEKIAASSLPEEAKEQILAGAESLLPIRMLKDQIFGSEEMAEVLTLEEVPASEIEEIKKAGEYSAVIEVPAQFTAAILQSLFIEETPIPSLTLYTNEGKEQSAAIVEDIIANFQEQFSIWSALGKEGLVGEVTPSYPTDPIGTVETLSKKDPIGSFSYYTIGMGVMFILYIASTISSRSFLEKQSNAFDRILLSNVPPWIYITSLFFSTIVLAVIQMALLYGVSALVYDVRWPEFLPFLAVSLVLILATGGISVLLTAINHRLGSEAASKLFMSAFVAICAFLGGSFTPIGSISETLAEVGQYTPNGAAMVGYMKAMQGAGLSEISSHLLVLLVTAIILTTVAILMFPRKERGI